MSLEPASPDKLKSSSRSPLSEPSSGKVGAYTLPTSTTSLLYPPQVASASSAVPAASPATGDSLAEKRDQLKKDARDTDVATTDKAMEFSNIGRARDVVFNSTLIPGKNPLPIGLQNRLNQYQASQFWWLPEVLGKKRDAHLNLVDDIISTLDIYGDRVRIAQRAAELDGKVADAKAFGETAHYLFGWFGTMLLAKQVWFESDWNDPLLNSATGWNDLINRATNKAASASSSSSPDVRASAQALQARVIGFNALSSIPMGPLGWPGSSTPMVVVPKPRSSSGSVNPTSASGAAHQSSPVAEEPRAKYVANRDPQYSPRLVKEVAEDEVRIAEDRASKYNADVRSHLPGQDAVENTLNNDANPLPPDTYQRLLAIWRKDGFWKDSPPDRGEIAQLRKILRFTSSLYNHQILVSQRDLPREGEPIEKHLGLSYKMKTDDRYHRIWDTRYWLDHWDYRLEYATDFWFGANGAWVRKTFPAAKSAKDVQDGIAALTKVQTDNKKGFLWGLSGDQEKLIYSYGKVVEKLKDFTERYTNGGKTYRLEWWGGSSAQTTAISPSGSVPEQSSASEPAIPEPAAASEPAAARSTPEPAAAQPTPEPAAAQPTSQPVSTQSTLAAAGNDHGSVAAAAHTPLLQNEAHAAPAERVEDRSLLKQIDNNLADSEIALWVTALSLSTPILAYQWGKKALAAMEPQAEAQPKPKITVADCGQYRQDVETFQIGADGCPLPARVHADLMRFWENGFWMGKFATGNADAAQKQCAELQAAVAICLQKSAALDQKDYSVQTTFLFYWKQRLKDASDFWFSPDEGLYLHENPVFRKATSIPELRALLENHYKKSLNDKSYVNRMLTYSTSTDDSRSMYRLIASLNIIERSDKSALLEWNANHTIARSETLLRGAVR